MNFKSQILLLVGLLLVVPGHSGRSRRNVLGDLDNFPNPTKDFEQCGRKQESFICDPELYIRPKTSDYLDQLAMNATKSDLVWCPRSPDNTEEKHGKINGIDRSNFELRGLQIGVALISSFKSYDHNIPVTANYNDYDYLSKKYSKSIHDQWGIGDKDCNNGIMIFISIDDRVLYISTGKGIKEIITDKFIDNYIMNKIRPKMRKELYDEAIVGMLDLVFEMLLYQDDQESSEVYKEWNKMKESDSPIFSFFGVFDVNWEDCLIATIVIGVLTYFYYDQKRQREFRECENRLAAIYAQAQQRRLNQESCPICLENFPTDSSNNNNNNNNDNNNGEERPTSLLPCGHKFCTECLDEWFGGRIRTNHVCPVCRHHRDDTRHIPRDENAAANPNNPNNNNNDNDTTSTTNNNTNNNDNSSNNRNQDQNDSKEDRDSNNNNNNNRDDRNDYRRNTSDFTQDFPSTDKNNQQSSASSAQSSTYYGASTGPQGRDGRSGSNSNNQDYERQREEDRQARQNNRFFRNYMRYNMMNDMMYRNDLNFRLRRMRHYYPRYIDDSMVNRWSNPNYNGGSFTSDTRFRANNPTPPPSHSGSSRSSTFGSRGSSGRSFRFGGGSSFGGGGGGGRW